MVTKKSRLMRTRNYSTGQKRLQELKALPWRKRFGSGGRGERAEDYIKQGLGLSTLPPWDDNAHLFALSRTLRIRQAFGLNVSTDYSISPLPTVLDYRQTLSDFHEISRGT